MFIHIVQEIWYTPPKSGGKKIAGGKLVEKLRNTLRCLKDVMQPTTATATEVTEDNLDECSGKFRVCD